MYKWESINSRKTLLLVSIGIAFVQFCVIVVWSVVKPCFRAGWRCRQKQAYDVINENIDNIDDITHERIEDPELAPLITYTKSNCASQATY